MIPVKLLSLSCLCACMINLLFMYMVAMRKCCGSIHVFMSIDCFRDHKITLRWLYVFFLWISNSIKKDTYI